MLAPSKMRRIVTADLVDVDDRAAMLLRDGAQHFDAQGAFVDGVGRGGDVQKDASSLLDELGDGVAGIRGLAQKFLSFQTSSQMVMPSCSRPSP